MIRASGIMFLTAKGECLFLKRGPGSDHPGAWCFPGGHAEGDETAEQTAERETIEEIGFLPDGKRVAWTRQITNNEIGASLAPEAGRPPTDAMVIPAAPVDYTTFIQRVPERFDPQVSGEHTGFAWALPTEPPEPLHPGARIALARLTMNELDIARALAAGELTSPQRYHNVWLFDIRITGTGYAFRGGARKEHAWRRPENYLTEDYLGRCNGLPVIWVHPKDSVLNSKEFSNRVIGTCFLPYVKGKEVWSIVKVWDQESAADMATQDLSTSPGVVLGGGDDVKVKLPDGSTLLIEGDPTINDHIAIVPHGVWDLGGPPSGIRTDSVKEPNMPEETEAEKKTREDAARRDADGGNIKLVLDAVQAMGDSFGKRLDAIEADAKSRRDADEEAKKERADAARRDAASRRDAERAEWMKEDAAQCAADDAMEQSECDAAVAAGEDKEKAADKARKDRRDRSDARRKDAQAEKDRKDAEKERADAARHDSAATIAKAVADALKAQQLPEADRAAVADEQARADAVCAAFGLRARRPMDGETAAEYQIASARQFQKHSPRWKNTNLALIPEADRNTIVADIYNDAAEASKSGDHIPLGQLVSFRRTNESGHQITEFRGRDSIFKTFSAPVMAVTQFNTEKRA